MANIYFPGSVTVLHWLNEVPLSPEQKEALSTSYVPLTVDMSGDDPWDWPIDRVVKELCTADRSWNPRGSLRALPTTLDLETKLRDEGIDGCILMCDVTEEYMKQDLGLTKLAWRVFVKGALEQLRVGSQKYAIFQRTGSYHTPSFALIEPKIHYDQIPPTPPAQHQQLPPVVNNSAEGESPINLPSAQGLLTSIDRRSARGEFLVSDVSGHKRRKLDLTNPGSNLALQDEEEAIYEAEQSDVETPQTEIPVPTPLECCEINGKKRKRIAPTLISTVIDPHSNRDIPTAADDVVHHDPQKIEPGVVFRSDDGKKRLIPIYQPGANDEKPYDYQALFQRQNLAALLQQVASKGPEVAQAAEKQAKKASDWAETEADGYLGKKKMPIDDIFYAKTPIGHELLTDDTNEVSVAPKVISSGRRLYVHRSMKKYLNAEHTALVRDGQPFYAIRPYPSIMISKPHIPSFSLFYASEDGKTHARRESLYLWPEIDPEAQVQKRDSFGVNTVTFNTSIPGILETVGAHDPLDPDLLEKYNHVEGGDEVLPLYGESGEFSGCFQSFQSIY